jgi:hypothetical protein
MFGSAGAIPMRGRSVPYQFCSLSKVVTSPVATPKEPALEAVALRYWMSVSSPYMKLPI